MMYVYGVCRFSACCVCCGFCNNNEWVDDDSWLAQLNCWSVHSALFSCAVTVPEEQQRMMNATDAGITNDFEALSANFGKFHEVQANIFLHLLTTPLGLIGLISLVSSFLFCQPHACVL